MHRGRCMNSLRTMVIHGTYMVIHGAYMVIHGTWSGKYMWATICARSHLCTGNEGV